MVNGPEGVWQINTIYWEPLGVPPTTVIWFGDNITPEVGSTITLQGLTAFPEMNGQSFTVKWSDQQMGVIINLPGAGEAVVSPFGGWTGWLGCYWGGADPGFAQATEVSETGFVEVTTMGAFTPTPITWQSVPPPQTLWQCGCLEAGATTPKSLLRWCGQPDCLRLAAANVAYTQRQFDWQTAHGGAPVLVAALLRAMVTPLLQILPPPPPGTQFFDIQYTQSADGTVTLKSKQKDDEDESKPGKEHEHDKKPGPPHQPADKPLDRPPQKQEPSSSSSKR